MPHLILLLALTGFAAPSARATALFTETFTWNKFYKGNTHTHSKRSDGDSTPDAVVAWYRSHGYDFIALTDHNMVTPYEFVEKFENDQSFKVIRSEEVSWMIRAGDGRPHLPVHVSALCTWKTIGWKEADLARSSALKKILELVRVQPNAIGIINHPNYELTLDLADFGPLKDYSLVEIFNQHPLVRNEGGTDKKGKYHPSTEVLWDRLLTAGRRLFAVASDDMHNLTATKDQLGHEPFAPGRGWVQVVAKRLDPKSLCEALSNGQFYSSTGVELEAFTVEENQMDLRIKKLDGIDDTMVKTEFIGQNGKVLVQRAGYKVSYRLRGKEAYVRARITAPGTTPTEPKRQAWTQPIRVSESEN